MKKKADKEKDVAALRADLEKTQYVIVAGFEKMTVLQDFELRKTVRAAGGKYKVIKNNVAEKAAEGTPSESVLKGLTGMTSLAYTMADPVALAKSLIAYAKTTPALTFKAGLVEGKVVDVKAINELASLPSREQILSKLLFLINAPAQRLLATINAVGRNLAVTIDQGVKENKFTA